jgi:hypothetical protein
MARSRLRPLETAPQKSDPGGVADNQNLRCHASVSHRPVIPEGCRIIARGRLRPLETAPQKFDPGGVADNSRYSESNS